MRQKIFTIINGVSLLIMITGCIVAYDYYENPTGWYDLALIFLPLTCILTLFLLRRLSLNPPIQDHSTDSQPFTRWQIASCMMGVICIFVLTLIHQPDIEVNHKLQFFLWLSGMGLITAGVTRGIPLQHIRAWTRESDARWLLLIVLIGLFLRIFLLETAIPRYVDEVNFAEGIHWLREKPNFKILTNTSGITNFVLVYFYYIYTELFGATLANLRAIGVLAGVLTIPAVYLLGRWAFTRRVGLLGAFLLAIDIPHIHFSRLAMSNIVDPLFGVLAIAFLWRGLQTQSWRWMGWGGVCLGMTSYVYEGGRLLYPALIVSWLIIYVLIRNGNVFKRGLLLFFIAFALVASGYYLPLSQLGSDTTPRLTSMRLNDKYITRILTMTDTNPITTYIDERITPAYLHIVSQPDASHYYYSEHGAIVIPYLLPFLFIGMGVALFYWRGLGLLLLLWVMITVVGNSLIWSNNWTPRFIVVFPGLMLLIALGLDTIYQGSARSLSKSLQYKVKLLAIIGLAGIGIFQMYFYFGILVPDFNLIGLVRADDFDAMWRAQELPATEVYVLPYDPLYHDYVAKIQSYERHHNRLKIFGAKDFDFLEFEPDFNKPYAFFIEDDDLDTRLGLRFVFGTELIGPEWSNDDRLPEEFQYILYKYIPSEK